MLTDTELLSSVVAALTRHPRVRSRTEGGDLRVACQDHAVLLEGWVESIGEKRIAERVAREMVGPRKLVNALRVRAVPARTDAEILAHIQNGLQEDPYLNEKQLVIQVEEGVVTLRGSQDALAKKRLAGLIAWWVAGVTDVRNEIAVEPPEEDSDDEITNAVRVAFDKDPLIDTLRYQVATRDGVVYLSGIASSQVARQAAEDDVWALWGVKDVQNQIAIEG